MRLSVLVAAIGVAVLSALATSYALHSGSSVTVSAREKTMLQEIDRLHQTIENMTADLNRINLTPDRSIGATPVVNVAAPKRGVTQTAAVPKASNTVTSTELPSTSSESNRPRILMVNPTPEQSAIFEGLKQRFDDPLFVRNLNLADLSQMEEMKALPSLLQKAILSKALKKFDLGEVDKSTFYAHKPSQPR